MNLEAADFERAAFPAKGLARVEHDRRCRDAVIIRAAFIAPGDVAEDFAFFKERERDAVFRERGTISPASPRRVVRDGAKRSAKLNVGGGAGKTNPPMHSCQATVMCRGRRRSREQHACNAHRICDCRLPAGVFLQKASRPRANNEPVTDRYSCDFSQSTIRLKKRKLLRRYKNSSKYDEGSLFAQYQGGQSTRRQSGNLDAARLQQQDNI